MCVCVCECVCVWGGDLQIATVGFMSFAVCSQLGSKSPVYTRIATSQPPSNFPLLGNLQLIAGRLRTIGYSPVCVEVILHYVQ